MNTLLWLCGLEGGTDAARVVESSWWAAAPLARPWLLALVGLGLALAAINLLPQLAVPAPGGDARPPAGRAPAD
jgi:hypothetical protein